MSFEYCVSINSSYINQESSRYTAADHGDKGYTYDSGDINVTLAHELGHYLGLKHVFAEKDTDTGSEPIESCTDTDYCTDTKSYNKPAYDRWLISYIEQHKQAGNDLVMKELIKRSNDSGEEWDSDNFMDYAVSLSFRFTPEQKYRMRQVLYYSPLIPGPKKIKNDNYGTRSQDNDEDIDLPICLAIEKAIPVERASFRKEIHSTNKNKGWDSPSFQK